MTIKAIETRYAGCRFRSRLEARWAVLFDHLGIRWEYEPQGYMVGPDAAQRAYLPDFYLTHLGLWVEVKGSIETVSGELLIDAAIPHWGLPLSPYTTEHPDPSRAGGRLLLLGPIDTQPSQHVLLSFWKGDVLGQLVALTSRGLRHTRAPEVRVGDDTGTYNPVDIDILFTRGAIRAGDPTSAPAYRAARSARFEHGQSG